MKCILPVLLCVAAAIAYDDINDAYVEKLQHDNKLLREAYGCLVDVNPCDDFGARAKSHVVELLNDGCRECDNVQKHNIHAFIVKLKNDFPDLYEKYEAKYDPTRTLLDKLDQEMLKYAK